jgi:ABC-type glycerol-3-phosphate transport system substrate-binding protein
MRKTLMILIAGAALVAGCGSGGGSSGSQGTQTVTGADGGTPSPSQFAERIDNPWLPFLPGMKWVYRGIKDGEPSRDVVTVPSETRAIQGVKCTVVKDML